MEPGATGLKSRIHILQLNDPSQEANVIGNDLPDNPSERGPFTSCLLFLVWLLISVVFMAEFCEVSDNTRTSRVLELFLQVLIAASQNNEIWLESLVPALRKKSREEER